MYKSVCSGPAVQGELCLCPGEECLRHRRGHLLVKVGGQCWMMSLLLEIDISVHAFSQKQQKIMSKIY